jgi:FkbH-like protein
MLSLLRHLPEPPADFRQRCRAASDERTLVRLAGHLLDGNKLDQLAQARVRVERSGQLDPVRLGILCNASTDFLPAAITASGLRHSLDIAVALGDYAQVLQEAANPASRLYDPPCDAVLLALDSRGLPLTPGSGTPDGAQVEAAIEFLAETRDALKAVHPTTVILQTVPALPAPMFGSMDAVFGGTERGLVHDLNAAIRSLVRGSPGDLLLDVEAIANAIGGYHWHSPTQWNVAKLQFSQQALPVYAEHVARLLAAMRGKSKKCLVLDLDNTVWGGAVGDLGVEGIVLGQGSALGEAFLEVQRTALALRERGIVLAVCSKNDEANAVQPFRDHPEMLLKEEHISVFQANWVDKATNLEEIARILDIGVDSLVLLDDNPAERIQVREALAGVAVPELPDDPSLYTRTLLNAGYFEAVSFTAEDAKRAEQYRANATRAKLKLSSRDPGEYLKSLEMTISFAHFDKLNRSRIVQLINKTNQFNLTTHRYTEAEVEAMENDPRYWTLQVRLLDRFGDNGMINVVICKSVAPKTWEIDTWLMSCRVLGRRVEECTMATVVAAARKAGAAKLVGRYLPTKKNGMVKDFYKRLGFTALEESEGGSTWQLDAASYRAAEVPMAIESSLR